MKWIGVWVENVDYIKVSDCYSYGNAKTEKELHIGLKSNTKIYMPNIYNDSDNDGDIWYPIYFGPAVMEFDHSILRFCRDRFGYTQQYVSDSIQTQLRTYQKWESGDTKPNGYNLIRLMNLFDIDSVQEFVKKESIYDKGYVKFTASIRTQKQKSV